MLNATHYKSAAQALSLLIKTGPVLALMALTACDTTAGRMAIVSAQPQTPAQRNHTNFYPALKCMDDLFAAAKRPTLYISANQIPDKTKTTHVDARGMVITALNHMTRKSKAFVFLEQGLVRRSSGDIIALEMDRLKPNRLRQPTFYINGSISQFDKSARGTSVNAEAKLLDSVLFDEGERRIEKNSGTAGGDHSVVTLDLHLVNYPSRVVVPGSAISNSITITQKAWNPGLFAILTQRTLGVSIKIDEVESAGQAVRSLIELGMIELLGNYTGVPYWECLSLPVNNAEDTARQKKAHLAIANNPVKLKKAQQTLQDRGYYTGKINGLLDSATRLALARYQADHGLMASGELDFETFRHLKKAPFRASTSSAAVPPPQNKAAPKADGYKPIDAFLTLRN